MSPRSDYFFFLLFTDSVGRLFLSGWVGVGVNLRRYRSITVAVVIAISGAWLLAVPLAADAAAICPVVDPVSGALTPAAAPGVDWSGCDLATANLAYANLTGANLSGATLTTQQLGYATLAGADLSGADLHGSFMYSDNLTNADLQGADLAGANMSASVLTDADLASANVDGTTMTQALFSGVHSGAVTGQPSLPPTYVLRGGYIFGPEVDLAGATLAGIDLTWLQLNGANLTGDMLAGADLQGTDISGATLTGVSLRGTNLEYASVSNDDLTAVDLTGALFYYTGLSGDDLHGRNFAGILFTDCAFVGSDLSGANFRGADLGVANLTGTNLNGANLTGAQLEDSTLSGATLAGATLTGVTSGFITGLPASVPADWEVRSGYLIGPRANLAGAGLKQAMLFNADLAGANLMGANLASADAAAADFTGATLTGASLVGADLAGAELTSTGEITLRVTWTRAICPNGKMAGKAGCFPANARLGRGPRLTLTARTGPGGDKISVSGAGFRSRVPIVVRVGGTIVKRLISSRTGQFGPARIVVPLAKTAGLQIATATVPRPGGQSATAWFTLQANWAQQQFGPGLNADNNLEHVLSAGNVTRLRSAWTFNPGLAGTANAPAISDGIAYVTSYGGALYALDASTGRQLWTWSALPSHAASKDYSAPAVTDDSAYFTVGGLVIGVGPNGHELWNTAASTSDFTSAPTATSGIIYVAGVNVIAALSAATGSTIWTAAPATQSAQSCSQPAVDAGVVFVTCPDGNLYALNAATGQTLWTYATSQPFLSSPTVSGGTVYLATINNASVTDTLYAISTTTHGLLWQYDATDLIGASPVIVGNDVYLISSTAGLTALTASTGAKLWTSALASPDAYLLSPTVADGVVYVADFHTELAFSGQTGKKLWSYTASQNAQAPVVVNDRLYIGTGAGGIQTLGLG
jgi:uncharacterized protein YjbI with pentapeptide repeats/outer membrane protein assembly factor BamB